MSKVTKTVDELLRELSSSRGDIEISLDGFPGAGKSCLAVKISRELNIGTLDFDDFLPNEGDGKFVASLDISKIERALVDAREKSAGFVVSGACLDHVLPRTAWQFTCRVYVKKLRANGLWYDGDSIEEPEHSAELYSDFDKEVIRYHQQYRPHEKCDVLFEYQL